MNDWSNWTPEFGVNEELDESDYPEEEQSSTDEVTTEDDAR